MEKEKDMETRFPAVQSSFRQIRRSMRFAGLAVVLIASGVGAGIYGSALAQGDATPVGSVASTAETADACPDELYGPDSEAWVRAELYFGTSKDDGTDYSEEEYGEFLDTEITPRFPDGLTLLTGLGQFQNDTEVIQERSQLLIILFPTESAAESSVKLEEIRDLYEAQFNQQSVLRADIANVCTSF